MMNLACSAIGTAVVLGLAYIGLKALISVVADTAIAAVVTLFTSPIHQPKK